MKLAIVGRRNTGKSTFINSLAQSERMIVSEVPGTTRDSVDVRFERDGKAFIAIDTAGVRQQGQHGQATSSSTAWPAPSARSAGPTWCCCSSTPRSDQQGGQAAGRLRPGAAQAGHLRRQQVGPDAPSCRPASSPTTCGKTFPSLDYVPIAFITAKSGKNVQAVLNLAQNLHKQASARVGTGDLNRVLRQALDDNAAADAAEPPAQGLLRHPGRPPTRRPSCCSPTGRSCSTTPISAICIKTFRDQLPFSDVPIKLYLRGKQREDAAPTLSDTPASPPKKMPKPFKLKAPPKGRKRGEAKLWDDV